MIFNVNNIISESFAFNDYSSNSTCSRVEGRLFYGHKIVLVSESPRLRAMLAPPRADTAPTSAPPLVQINDIRYHIFEVIKNICHKTDAR